MILDVEAIGSEVGGESAGAMFSIAIVSAYTGKKINPGTTMSAGITEDGLLFAVDSIEEKILAAKTAGKTRFVVAKNQGVKAPEDVGIEVIRAAPAEHFAFSLEFNVDFKTNNCFILYHL